jgi:magnesium transporter
MNLSKIKNLTQKARAVPGTPIHTGEKKVDEVIISIYRYNEEKIDKQTVNIAEKNRHELLNIFLNSELIKNADSNSSVLWINIKGLHDTELIKDICGKFDIHNLTVEDILNTAARPKVENFDDYLMIIMHSLHMHPGDTELTSEQVSIIIKSNFVLSFQEGGISMFAEIRDRLKQEKNRIRKRGNDYLAYALMDKLVDGYFILFEVISARMEQIDEELSRNPDHNTLKKIQSLKNISLHLRKSIWPLREMFRFFLSGESAIINESSIPFFRDINDHVIQIMDIIESIKEMLTGMHDIYLSIISNRLNEVMKVLTIIATIFIPLTFFAGIYGMNFKYMPGLEWKFGFYCLNGIMLIIAIIMLLFFKKKKWL